jgi:DNA-binding beta-propeller fold protein YncE
MANPTRRCACALLVCCIVAGPAVGENKTFADAQSSQTDVQQSAASLSFVRAFSSADDVRRFHPFLNRAIEFMAGHKDADVAPVNALQSPSAVTTDSNHHVFVADPGANAVHVFDFSHAKYSLLEKGRDRLGSPVSLAVDAHNNLYVVDKAAGTVIIYDSAGNFRGHFWTPREKSYRESPAGIAIDKATGLVYVCDRQRHIIVVMDDRGRPISQIGKLGGGDQSGEFRFPSQVVVEGGELFVLDAGNTRIQILDPAGHFRRAIPLTYADHRTGLAVDGRDNIYVSNFVLNQIEVHSHDADRLYIFDLSTVQGEKFIHPSSLWVDAGYCLYVVDSQSNRVGLFQISGKNARQCR